MRKKVAWIVNLMNIGVLAMLVVKGLSPMYGAIACTIALLTTFIAIIPEAIKIELTQTDTIL